MIALKCLESFILYDVFRSYREKFVRSWFKRPYCSVQSDVLAIGSFDKVFSGKTYNRAVRVNKLVQETLHRVLPNKIEDNDVDSSEYPQQYPIYQKKE